MAPAKAKCVVEAGLLVRNEFRRKLMEYCFRHNITLDKQEDKGWFSSTFYIRMTGEEVVVKKLVAWIKEIVDE